MTEKKPCWSIRKGANPLVVTAIHNGHAVRDELLGHFALSSKDRLREEDPYTGLWTSLDGGSSVVCQRSRFEFDLNRPREKAVYIKPEDAWNLDVWKTPPRLSMIDRSLGLWDVFYSDMHQLLSELKSEFGRFVVFDLHSYNHKRGGIAAPAADPAQNPEINIGTGTMDRDFWAPLVDRFISDLNRFNCGGRNLDVRENVRFRGGHFPRWIHENFPQTGCALAIEVKKFFMDEWSGKADDTELNSIRDALQSTVPGVLEELKKLV